MPTIQRQIDKDIIVALTSDYLNIYHIRPNEDLADIIKLDGFVIDGIEQQRENLSYSTLVRNYAKSRVYPEDYESFMVLSDINFITKEFAEKTILDDVYRVFSNGEIHYYNYKFVKVSEPDEPLRLIAAFRCIDDIETKELQRLTQLERLKEILSSSQMGTWNVLVRQGEKSQLIPDEKMIEITGFTRDNQTSPEEMFEMLVSRVYISDKYIYEQFAEQIQRGEKAECTLRWQHPTKGLCYMRCGGVSTYSDKNCIWLNGYFYDVTEQMVKESRANHIIKMFASTYDFINYINLDDDTFYTYSVKEIENDAIIDVLLAGSFRKAINIGLENIVSDEYKPQMTEFLNIDTIDARMEQSNVLVVEFKDVSGIWYEMSFIVAERRQDKTIQKLLWTVRLIDSEKQIELRKQKILEDNIAANEAKTKFLQNMSHEIRTPLNAMFGFAQLLGLPDGSCTEEEKAQYNKYIYNSYKMLEMLISDIIDIADSENGNYRIEISEIQLNSVCRNAMMSVEFRVPVNVKLYMTTDFDDDYVINSDERRIQQVLINYLTNACKNTQKGEIHLHVSKFEKPGKICFSVTDTGRGVPPAKAADIFNRFTKLNQFVQGSGLGLSICQTIASKLDGEVFLDTTYTDGARFVFVINDK